VEFSGAYGSFFFDERVTLRRGSFVLDGTVHSIGLFDYGNNGLFNDTNDVLIADTHGDGRLQYYPPTEVFKLKDVFTLAGRNFKIHDLDKYGTWVELEETQQPATFHFMQDQDSIIAAGARKTGINAAIWEMTGITLDGDSVSLNQYKGKYLLLNFWGEWCGPCVEEIPALVKARQRYSASTIGFVSFVDSQNIDKAKKLIAESGISSPQLRLSNDIKEKLRIKRFPTNILIYPDGHTCIVTFGVSDAFFKMYLK
jgi:thiol-disulfide isomerase/thioredoxin